MYIYLNGSILDADGKKIGVTRRQNMATEMRNTYNGGPLNMREGSTERRVKLEESQRGQ